MRARQMVNERMTQARALPNVSTPPTLLQPVATANRIMNVGLSSKSVSLIDMSMQAQWTIVPRLTGVPGVANVSIWGQRNRQVQVQVDPAKLHDKGVTLDQVVKTAGEAVWSSPLTYLNSSTPGSGRLHRHAEPETERTSRLSHHSGRRLRRTFPSPARRSPCVKSPMWWRRISR